MLNPLVSVWAKFSKLALIAMTFFPWSYESKAQVNRSVFENLLTELESKSLYVNDIVQDKKGFIWFGTEEGLIRHDGVTLRYYLPETGNNRSISHKWITKLFIDSKGTLWIGTRRGLNRYNELRNDFDRFLNDPENPYSISNDEVSAICEDGQKNIWIGTFSGLNELSGGAIKNPDSLSFKRFYKNSGESSSLMNNTIWAICFDSLNRGWIGTDDGLVLMSIKDNHSVHQFTHFRNNPHDKYSIAQNNVLKIFLDAKGNLWLTSKQGMLDLLPAASLRSGQYRFLHLLPQINSSISANIKSVNVFFLDSHNNGWLGLPEMGAVRFSFENDSTLVVHEHFRNNPSNNRSICGNSVWSIYEDRSRGIWIGTESGVSKYTYTSQLFSEMSIAETNYNFESTVINSLQADEENNIWIGSLSDTVYCISSTRKKLARILCAPRNSFQVVNQVLLTKDKKLYAGTNRGLYVISVADLDRIFQNGVYRTAAKIIRNDPGQPRMLTSNMILSLYEDEKGVVWVGTGKGLDRIDPASEGIVQVYPEKMVEELNASYIVRDIAGSRNGDLWIGTDNGLIQLNPKTNAITQYIQRENDPTSIPDNTISYICESDNGFLWIGTGRGLTCFDVSEKKFSLHPLIAGADYFSISAIAEQKDHHLWVSSNRGLFRYNPVNNHVNHYTVNNGLCTNRFVATAVCSATGDLLFFGGEKGFISFYPEKIAANATAPPVAITDFKLFDASVLSASDEKMVADFIENRKISLKYDQNFFSIDYAALNYLFPEANHYSYQLEGIDKNPVAAGNRTTASYTNVPPGSYRFKVSGSNNDGVWNQAGASLEILIKPPWWQTWWFYSMIVIAVAASLYAIYRYRISQIKKLFTLRSKIARDLHDDVGSTLSSISLMSQLAKDRSVKEESEQELFETISSASKEAMELMSDIVWSVNPNNDKLSNILVRMREYAADILEAADIDFVIDVAEDAKEVVIPMEKRKDFYLIFKEAVNNIAKYSLAANAAVRLLKEHHHLIMVVEDDGRGFEVEKLRSGNGLVNMKDRAKFIGGNLTITSEIGKGTNVRLEMKIVAN